MGYQKFSSRVKWIFRKRVLESWMRDFEPRVVTPCPLCVPQFSSGRNRGAPGSARGCRVPWAQGDLQHPGHSKRCPGRVREPRGPQTGARSESGCGRSRAPPAGQRSGVSGQPSARTDPAACSEVETFLDNFLSTVKPR